MTKIISINKILIFLFVCGARNLGEALRRIGEGASMIRTKGEAGTGNVVEAVRHFRTMQKDINRVKSATSSELMHIAKEMGTPFDLVCYVHEHGNFLLLILQLVVLPLLLMLP